MGKQPFISHVVNGYSRYDVPESKAFTMTPGILYPVRIDFINARDRVTIEQGIDVRSNPLAVPSFNPYTVRLHRFWVPLQLYHPEMRTNSSKFDMNNLSLNWLPRQVSTKYFGTNFSFSNSLISWLRAGSSAIVDGSASSLATVSLPGNTPFNSWFNADTYLAYWDIVRNYYSFSQWSLFSFAWPASWSLRVSNNSGIGAASARTIKFAKAGQFFTQSYGNLEYLDLFYESQFYPSAVTSTNDTYNRYSLFYQIILSDTYGAVGVNTPSSVPAIPSSFSVWSKTDISSQFSVNGSEGTGVSELAYFLYAHPMAVVPSNPDRFSRLLPNGSSSAVSMTGVNTIPQLAIASRLQEYKDLLGAGGSRYSDWLETFFASKIAHVDRPKLLFAASQMVNVQVVMNQSGQNNFSDDNSSGGGNNPLGQQGGAIAFNAQLGRSQSYYFDEPGYMIDMLSIRPVYYWAGVRPDYLNYQGSDYFNPIYNDIGYQAVPAYRLMFTAYGTPSSASIAQEPCFNEFRSSYDEVLGQISASFGQAQTPNGNLPLYSYWVQQRFIPFDSAGSPKTFVTPLLFVDVSQVNSPFASNVEDNFFVNMSYAVRKKNLVNKTFATRLSNR